MCGVFGFVSFNGKGPSIKRLQQIATVTERRGRHAFGFAWVDSQGRLKSFKATGKITNYLHLLELAHDAQFLIGHCRWATHGSADNNLNNHPHPVDGGWFVHNGVIADHHAIVKENGLHPVTQCDSETLGLLIEAGEGRLKTRCIEAVQYASGSPLVFLGVWSRPGRLIALRSGNPLSVGLCKGRVYLASLQEGLPGNVSQVQDNHGIDFAGGKMIDIKFSRNASGISGPADDSDDDAEPDEAEWDLDDEPVQNVKHVQTETVEEWKARIDAESVTVTQPCPAKDDAKDDGRGIPADWKPNKTKEKIESYWQGVRKKRRAGRLEGLDISNAEVYGIDYAAPDDHAALAAIADAAKITQQQLDAMDRSDWRGDLVAIKDGTAQLSRSGKVKFTDDQLTRLNRGFEKNLARLTKPNGLVPIPGTAGGDVPQPGKPPAPKLKPKLRGGLGQRELWN